MVTIVIPCMNLSYQTKDCIGALACNVDYPFKVIVINNASTDDTQDFLDNYAEDILAENEYFNGFQVFHNETNNYLAGAINQGVEASDTEFISIVANDIMVPENMYSELISKIDDSVGAIGPWYTENEAAEKLNPIRIDSVLYYLELVNGKSDEVLTDWHFSVCHIMSRKAWDKIGPWDTNLKTHCNDNDWGIRLELCGYKAVTYKKFVCYHQYGSFGRKQIPNETGVAKVDTEYFHNKWGIYSHQKTFEIPGHIVMKAREGNYVNR